jgi:hypothetical protein
MTESGPKAPARGSGGRRRADRGQLALEVFRGDEVESGAHIMHFHAPDRLARVVRWFLELPPDRVCRVQASSNQRGQQGSVGRTLQDTKMPMPTRLSDPSFLRE